MAVWRKVMLYWATMLGSTGSTLTATSTASGYDVKNVYSTLETNMWKAAVTTAPQILTYDAGAGNTKTADYLVIYGHNLFTAAVTSVNLDWSDNGTDYTVAWSSAPTANTIILAEFTVAAAHRYWRLRLYQSSGNFTEVPYIKIALWGNRTELDFIKVETDPHEQRVVGEVSLTEKGVVAGVQADYVDRRLTLGFRNLSTTTYALLNTWWDGSGSGLNNCFVAWELANNAADVWLMRPADKVFTAPFTKGGLYRNATINLEGRKV